MYKWMRGECALLHLSPASFWCVCILFYAFWVWLALFLLREYKQYPGMKVDALFGGVLLAVASALVDADVLSVMSKKGFGWAAWGVLLSAFGLAFRNRAFMPRNAKGEAEPSTGDEGLPAE